VWEFQRTCPACPQEAKLQFSSLPAYGWRTAPLKGALARPLAGGFSLVPRRPKGEVGPVLRSSESEVGPVPRSPKGEVGNPPTCRAVLLKGALAHPLAGGFSNPRQTPYAGLTRLAGYQSTRVDFNIKI